MKELYRLIDANLNRVSEGLRVLEDVARFRLDRADLCAELRTLRHAVREGAETLSGACLAARAADSDVGLEISQTSGGDERGSPAALMSANFKRAEEGLRVIEESLKLNGSYSLAKEYEALRFRTYALEQAFLPSLRHERVRRLLDTDLYGITAEEHSRGRSSVEVVREMIAAGLKVVQYREKDKEPGARYRDCLRIREMTREAGVALIVNDHPDLAVLVGADGVHLGQDDYPLGAVRTLVGEDLIIGLSTHSPAQAAEAVKSGADYIGVGPLYRTFTKRNVCDPVGLEYLDYAAAHVPLPFVALGGVKVHNVAEVRRHGGRPVALVTEIVGADDIPAMVRTIREQIQEAERQIDEQTATTERAARPA